MPRLPDRLHQLLFLQRPHHERSVGSRPVALTFFPFLAFRPADLPSARAGIVSLLFCGITLKHYAYHNMSPRTQRSSRYMFGSLASLSENFIFIYLGASETDYLGRTQVDRGSKGPSEYSSLSLSLSRVRSGTSLLLT